MHDKFTSISWWVLHWEENLIIILWFIPMSKHGILGLNIGQVFQLSEN